MGKLGGLFGAYAVWAIALLQLVLGYCFCWFQDLKLAGLGTVGAVECEYYLHGVRIRAIQGLVRSSATQTGSGAILGARPGSNPAQYQWFSWFELVAFSQGWLLLELAVGKMFAAVPGNATVLYTCIMLINVLSAMFAVVLGLCGAYLYYYATEQQSKTARKSALMLLMIGILILVVMLLLALLMNLQMAGFVGALGVFTAFLFVSSGALPGLGLFCTFFNIFLLCLVLVHFQFWKQKRAEKEREWRKEEAAIEDAIAEVDEWYGFSTPGFDDNDRVEWKSKKNSGKKNKKKKSTRSDRMYSATGGWGSEDDSDTDASDSDSDDDTTTTQSGSDNVSGPDLDSEYYGQGRPSGRTGWKIRESGGNVHVLPRSQRDFSPDSVSPRSFGEDDSDDRGDPRVREDVQAAIAPYLRKGAVRAFGEDGNGAGPDHARRDEDDYSDDDEDLHALRDRRGDQRRGSVQGPGHEAREAAYGQFGAADVHRADYTSGW